MANAKTAEIKIRDLAKQHGIVAERTALDEWADVVTNLSGDEVIRDEVEDLVVTLQRAGILSDAEAHRLYADHIVEQGAEEKRDTRLIRERLAKTIAMSDEFGPYGSGNHKRETDEMWGEKD